MDPNKSRAHHLLSTPYQWLEGNAEADHALALADSPDAEKDQQWSFVPAAELKRTPCQE
jgi:hypothetical protein